MVSKINNNAQPVQTTPWLLYSMNKGKEENDLATMSMVSSVLHYM